MNANKIKRLGIFCGSRIGNSDFYSSSVEKLADVMSQLGITLIYGGAKVGLMGIIANRMLKQGANVIGVIPRSLVDVEIAHDGLTELHVVDSMQERKTMMAELADGFIMLPGGPGSLDEFFEMLTLGQLGYHPKPCGILNVAGYYDHLLKFLDHAVAQGFLNPTHRNMIVVQESPELLIQKFSNYEAPLNVKWKSQKLASER